MNRGIQLCIVGVFLVTYVSAGIFILEAEKKRNVGNHQTRMESEASHGKALLLTVTQPLSVNFCTRQRVPVSIAGIIFSNGNKADEINITIDGMYMGTFRPPAIDGNHNHFLSTGRLPATITLETGWHVLKIIDVQGDGIVVDRIDLDIPDPKLTQELFECKLTCLPAISFPPNPLASTVSAGWIVQKSYNTSCAEVDNVDVPIYQPFIEKYQITASLPQYRSFVNNRDLNTSNCEHLSPLIWSFQKVHFGWQTAQVNHGRQAYLMFQTGFIVVVFGLEGRSKGSIDAEIGSELTIRLSQVTLPVTLTLTYRGRSNRMSQVQSKTLTSKTLTATWKIPDFTWTENGDNFIMLTMDSVAALSLQIDSLVLVKRPMKPEVVSTIYRSDDVIVEAVHVDLWWTAPDTMNINLANGRITNDVAYFRIYRPVPWHSGYAQVFVLYQDGNIRLLPISPHGLDWIPFGSSVILGQTNPDDIRPWVSISQVELDPENLSMRLQYKNGASCHLKMINTLTNTKLIIDHIDFKDNPFRHPFATVRSMYVTEGNTDCDHVNVDGLTSYHIMDAWGTVTGKSFVFHRQCESHHLTLSPDIRIDLLDTRGIAPRLSPVLPQPTRPFAPIVDREAMAMRAAVNSVVPLSRSKVRWSAWPRLQLRK